MNTGLSRSCEGAIVTQVTGNEKIGGKSVIDLVDQPKATGKRKSAAPATLTDDQLNNIVDKIMKAAPDLSLDPHVEKNELVLSVVSMKKEKRELVRTLKSETDPAVRKDVQEDIDLLEMQIAACSKKLTNGGDGEQT